MFNWFKKIASPAPPTAPVKASAIGPAPRVDPAPPTAPRQNKGIGFDPNLIDQYQADHRHLLALFGRAKEAAETAQWSKVAAALGVFSAALTDHLLSERVRLYAYLKESVADDPDSVELMKHFSSEMHGIGKVVMSFLDDQRDLGHSPAKQGAFLAAWMDIGRTLGDRIAREEKTLYPMYRASN